VPALPNGLTYVEISAGGSHAVARRSDGSIVQWGYFLPQITGPNIIPPLPTGLTYVEVSAGDWFSLARRSDGSVVAWGAPVSLNVPALPSGLTYVEIAAGMGHAVALRSDGSVVAWGQALGWGGPAWVPAVPALPSGLKYVHVAAGSSHNVALVDFAGAAVPVGTGCGGAGTPTFDCSAPQIGNSVFLTLTAGTPNAAGFVFGLGVPATPYQVASGCFVEVDLGSLTSLFPVMTNGAGAWGMGLFIPPDHNLVGIQAALQVALFGTAGPLGVDISNGLIVTIGS
jgi:hypothetical protein